MATGIDHIVIAVPDPDAAAAELEERIGLEFTAGGRHPGLGTFNRIAFLGDAYLELIGVDDPAAAQGWAVGRAALRALESGGGFATWALGDDDLGTTVARLQATGSAIGDPVHGSRAGTDGELTEWWTATLPEVGPGLPPFLIQHAARGDEWGPRAMAARRAFVHPMGASAVLLGLEIAVTAPRALATACAAQLSLAFRNIQGAAVCAVGRQQVRLVSPSAAGPAARVTIGVGRGQGQSVTTHGVVILLADAPQVDRSPVG